MSLSSTNSVVKSGWRERAGERSELERDPPIGLQAAHGSQSAAALPDPQVVPTVAKANRRHFSASDKQRILAAVDQAT